ncbi:MAG: phosphatase PAP2 family protein [Deltaproteobacteria bacterium]|nr:phosphatase PAP2 family protein [Deltaproteobacteria bacterium]
MNKKVVSLDRWVFLITGFIGLTAMVYSFSFLIEDEIDWRILLYLNPDSYIPIIEELMIFLSDFSMVVFGLIFLSWEVAYQASKHSQKSRLTAQKTLKVIGTVIACATVSGFFWERYEHSIVFFPLALFVFAGFQFAGNILVKSTAERLEQINHLFWMTLLSALLVQVSVECIIKDAVGRPRPLSDAYSAYNWGIRGVADELVKRGNSYVAGHSATFFGMITPMIFSLSARKIQICLLLWALVHSFSRVYLGAHFPFCSLMGSALGFFMGFLVIKTFGLPERKIGNRLLFRLISLILVACFLYFFFFPHGRFCEVVDGCFYRSAQLRANALDGIIKSKGIKTVINLSGEKTGKKWFEQEQVVCERNKVPLLSFDMAGPDLPRNFVVHELIGSLTKADRPVLIHCRSGVDATGFVSALALCLDQDPPLSVIETQLSRKFGLTPVYCSVGAPIFFAYKNRLKKHSRNHSWETLLDWLKNEYTNNLTPVQYYIDGINNIPFKHSRLTLKSPFDEITLQGWAFSSSTRAPPKHFKVFIDRQPLPPAVFSRNRPDVAEYYRLGPPFEQTFVVGWEITIAGNSLTKGKHHISFKIGSDDADIVIFLDKKTFRIL